MAPPSIRSMLKKSLLFEALSDAELRSLSDLCHRKVYDAGDLVFAEGDCAVAFFLVMTGRVQAYKIGAEGKEMILHLVEPGEVFAEYPIFGGMPTYPAYAQCLEPTTLLAIPGEAFKAFVADKPEVLMRILARFSQRIREFSGLIEDLSLRHVDARLAKYLLMVSETATGRAVIPIQKKTLAAILGTIPETLSRAFKRLKAQGVLRFEREQVEILDLQALKAIAES